MIEYRNIVGGVEGDGKTLRGLATPFNVWTTIGSKANNGFDERMAPGVVTKTLQERDVVLIHNHNTAMPMARSSVAEGPGRLTLTPNAERGLEVDAEPVDTSYSRDVLACAKAKVIRGMSIGFEVVKDSWTDDAGNPSDKHRGTKRTVQEIRLHEVTTTAFPAYETTELSARDSINAARGIEEAREARDDAPEIPAQSGDHSGPHCAGCQMSSSDGDSDSDGDDQEIDRTSEPAETTRGESDEEYAAEVKRLMADYIRTR